jgi:hypothetical protein
MNKVALLQNVEEQLIKSIFGQSSPPSSGLRVNIPNKTNHPTAFEKLVEAAILYQLHSVDGTLRKIIDDVTNDIVPADTVAEVYKILGQINTVLGIKGLLKTIKGVATYTDALRKIWDGGLQAKLLEKIDIEEYNARMILGGEETVQNKEADTIKFNAASLTSPHPFFTDDKSLNDLKLNNLKKLKICRKLKEKLENNVANSGDIESFLETFLKKWETKSRRWLGVDWVYGKKIAMEKRGKLLKKIPNYYNIDDLLTKAQKIIELLPPRARTTVDLIGSGQITIENPFNKQQAMEIYKAAVTGWQEITKSVSYWGE